MSYSWSIKYFVLFIKTIIFRSDNFESSLATLVQLGTSALKVGMSTVGDAGPGQQFASKVGVASGAPSTPLTPEETLHKQQVTVTRNIDVTTHVLGFQLPCELNLEPFDLDT